MGFETLIGESCFTDSAAQKLADRINAKSPAKVSRVSGQWLYYVNLDKGIDDVKKLVQATAFNGQTAKTGAANSIQLFVTPRTYPSPWSSKATSIAEVCGVHASIERGHVVTIEFENPFDGDLSSFKDILHDRMTESLTEAIPDSANIFAEGARAPLVVVDIFADSRGPLAALQDYNKQVGLGLDEANVEYLVEQYKSLGRSPVSIASPVA